MLPNSAGLSARSSSHKDGSIYVMDEPTTGLHMSDITHLLTIMDRLVDEGNSVIVIEHNLDVIRNADWIIDLGPEGGSKGGEVVFEGTPTELVKEKRSLTGQYLRGTRHSSEAEHRSEIVRRRNLGL
jgi:excinuclease UvrABC ATPase subunit